MFTSLAHLLTTSLCSCFFFPPSIPLCFFHRLMSCRSSSQLRAANQDGCWLVGSTCATAGEACRRNGDRAAPMGSTCCAKDFRFPTPPPTAPPTTSPSSPPPTAPHPTLQSTYSGSGNKSWRLRRSCMHAASSRASARSIRVRRHSPGRSCGVGRGGS